MKCNERFENSKLNQIISWLFGEKNAKLQNIPQLIFAFHSTRITSIVFQKFGLSNELIKVELPP